MLKVWLFYVLLESSVAHFFPNLAAQICPHLAAISFVKSQTDEFVRMNPLLSESGSNSCGRFSAETRRGPFQTLNITAYCSIWASLNWKEVSHHTKKNPAIKEPVNKNVLIYLNPSRS